MVQKKCVGFIKKKLLLVLQGQLQMHLRFRNGLKQNWSNTVAVWKEQR